MAINGLPPVPNSFSLVTPVIEWAGHFVAPIDASLLTKDGMMELAGRVYWIVALVIGTVVVFAAKNGYLKGRITTSGPSSLTTTAVIPRGSATNESRAVESFSDNSAQQAGEALKLIKRQFKALFLDLRQIYIPNGLVAGIEKSLQEFHQNFDKHKDLSDCSTHFKGIKYIETNLSYLKSMREYLFLAPIRMDDKGIISQPSDGNCLYHSLVRGFELLKDNLIQRAAWIEEPLDHESLREKVVRWMIANSSTDIELRDYLDRAVDDYIEVRKGQYMGEREGLEALRLLGEDIAIASASLSDAEQELSRLEALDQNQRHKWYLDQAGQPRFFASVAEMYAFSRLYPQVSVHVWRELGGEWNNKFDPPFNNSDLTINLAYNLSGDHFNIYVPTAQRSFPDQPSFVRSVEK